MLAEQCIPAEHGGVRARQQRLFSFLQSCKTIKQLTQIHAQIITNGLAQKNFILGKLLSIYIIYNRLAYATKVFEFVRNPSTILWNQIIRGHANGEQPRLSVLHFQKMGKSLAVPDGYTYSYVVNGCAKGVLLSEGEQVHGKIMRNGYFSDVFVQTNLVNFYSVNGIGSAEKVFDEMTDRTVVAWNSLISGHFRCGNVDEARRIFHGMPERNVVSWTAMIAGCAQNERCKEALSFFHEMRRNGVEFDQVTLVSVLSTCAEMAFLDLGRWIHSYVLEASSSSAEKGPVLVSLNNALIHMYSSCGEIKDAFKVFKDMPIRTTVSWTSMITGFAKQGYAEEALTLFKKMRNGELKPDEITLLGVLCACSHAGYINEGRFYFKTMTESWGVEPRIQHYGCMVDLLSRAGLFDEAETLVENMPMQPNNAVWGALLGGCRIHKNAELASDIARKFVIELEPERSVGYFVLLANVYASEKRWQSVASVRQKMFEMRARKPPGQSCIQIDGVSHGFLAGDTTHKHAHLIYEMLDGITGQAKLQVDGVCP
ncbi:PREDICTED: pentatricopeptide repeat-containing protein At5g66520-like [Ipomoea nil]|uniref:pentatricopeptide repeat-containing protein At5g66520-like n=1 Tax=Ipomoea nil TaxID=35883 RepID=UPI0009010150|nr:PREDICTED: pentatricopeptide repeat-containing protein At5g66520-like [Ipomoea nil]